MPEGELLLDTDTNATLQQVMQQALSEGRPSAIIATGDLVHSGGTPVYRRFLSIITDICDAPLLCLPGNHDLAGEMRDAQLPMQTLTLGSWSVVGLDYHEDDVPKADIDAAKRDALVSHWREQTARFALLATHHPLLPIGSPWLDKDRIDDPETLLDQLIATPRPRFAGAVFGHAHQVIQGHYCHRPLLGTPSTAFQFLPRSEKFATDERPPGYRWLTLDDDGHMHSQVRWLH
jgi:Icc protein